MAIRHAMTFTPRRQQTVVFNKTYVVNQPTVQKTGNGAFWGGLIGGLLTGMGNMFLNNNTRLNLNGQNPYAYLNENMGKEPATETGKKEPSVMTTTQPEIKTDEPETVTTPEAVTPSKETEETDQPDGKGGIEYGIDHDPGSTTLDIKKGYTWFNIVSAKYDIPSGVSTKDVALALAAANSGAQGTEAMNLAHQGVYFKVGDLVNLPEKLVVNGQEISLKGDHQTQAVTPDDYDYVKATHWSAKVTQVGDKWYVTENGVRRGEAYDTEADANAAKAQLEAQQNAE